MSFTPQWWPLTYNAFISYSHTADGRLAPALQRGLQRLARPWYRAHALRVFRDETGLSVNPHLWTSIEQALDEAEWFVVLCSPEAAGSPWVERELEHWLTTKPVERILPVLTEGDLVWDAAADGYDPDRSTALPPALRGVFTEEPRHLDLRWARDELQLDLGHARFRAAIAEIAAPLHGIPKDELESEDVRLARRARRYARGGVAVLALLTAVAVGAGFVARSETGRANREADRARAEATRALGRQLSATARTVLPQAPDRALLLAVEGYRIHPEPATLDALARVVAERPPGLERLIATGDPLDRDPVVSVEASADGLRVVTVTSAGAIAVWDTESGAKVGATTGVEPSVVAVSRTGTFVAVADGTETRVWNVEDDSEHRFDGAASAAAFSDADEQLAFVADGRPWRWAFADEDPSEFGDALPDSVRAEIVDWSDNGEYVAFGGHDTTAELGFARTLDTEFGRAAGPDMFGHTGDSFGVLNTRRLIALVVDDSSDPLRLTTVARGAYDAALIEWDVAAGTPLRSVAGPQELARYVESAVAITPDLRTVATASSVDGIVRVRDLETGAEVRVPLDSGIRYSPGAAGNEVDVETTQFGGPDFGLVLTGATDGSVRVFTTAPQEPFVSRTPLDIGFDPRFSVSARRADGSAAVLVGIDTAAVIDLETRAVRTEPLPFAITPLVRVALGPDAGVVAVADAGTLRIWDMDTGTVETASLPDGRPTVVGFDGAGHVAVVVGSEDPTLVFFDAATAERVTPVADTFAGAILDARVGSSGLLAATSAGARRWQAGATTPERIDAPWGTDTDLAFAADRDDVVATLTSEGLFAWRGAQEVPLFQRTADTQRWPFAVSNDGSLAASTLDGLVRVWDGETGLPIGAPRTVGGGLVTEMAFTTGQSVALLVVDTTKVEPTLELVEIDLDPEQWAAQACAVANRNLGEDEWARDVGPLVPYRSTCL